MSKSEAEKLEGAQLDRHPNGEQNVQDCRREGGPVQLQPTLGTF